MIVDIASFFLGCITTLIVGILVVYFNDNLRPRY